jgi:D-serine deaminase-like pyridoxal phosphate-dependent protein
VEEFNNISIPTCKEQIETPSLLIDLPIMESNLRRMAEFFQDKPAKLRPHVKTHKTPILAHKQIEAGSTVGITAAKLGEAEVMIKAGIRDVLVANQIVEVTKIARLAGLSRHAMLTVAVDNVGNVEMLNQAGEYFRTTINVLVEVNVGLNRCGTEWGEPSLRLTQEILKLPNLNFRGIMGYEGHAVLVPDPKKRAKLAAEAMDLLLGTKEMLEKNGIPVEIVSAGGTGTYNMTGATPGITEIQAGSYIFMDSRYQQTGVGFSQALTLYTTVISRPRSEIAILDAGMKAVTHENGLPEVKDHKDWNIQSLHEEHAIMHISGGDQSLKPGDKLELIPSHGCTTINLHDQYYGLNGNHVEAVWEIEGRGKFR